MRRLIFLFALFFFQSLQAQIVYLQDPMMPHPIPQSGPWFEGWYYRITDHDKNLSFAIIGTSAYRDGRIIPGYAAVVLHLPDTGLNGSKTRSFEAYPAAARTDVAVIRGRNEFIWQGEPVGQIQRNSATFQFDDVLVQLNVEDRKPWGSLPGSGPAGVAHLFSLFPLSWYVDNTSGSASYKISLRENGEIRTYEGRGFIHQEKNWGEVFPNSWMWVQAIDSTGEASIALAGGEVEWSGLSFTTYLLGYRSKNLNVDFNLGNDLLTQFETLIDPCAGRFNLTGFNRKYRIEVQASDAPDRFAYVSIPTKDGYAPEGGIESFSASVDVRIFERPFYSIGRERLVEQKRFNHSALEFGGLAMNCPQR